MPRKQTRKSISVKGLTYQRLSKYCDQTGQTRSGFVENLLEEVLGAPTDEECQKFGGAQETGDKGDTATKAEQENPHDAQETTPAPADESRESTPAPTREPVVEPIPKPVVEPKRKPVVEPVYEPKTEPAREAAPDPEPKRSRIWDNPLNRGTPAEPIKEESEETPEGFEDYVPPILEF